MNIFLILAWLFSFPFAGAVPDASQLEKSLEKIEKDVQKLRETLERSGKVKKQESFSNWTQSFSVAIHTVAVDLLQNMASLSSFFEAQGWVFTQLSDEQARMNVLRVSFKIILTLWAVFIVDRRLFRLFRQRSFLVRSHTYSQNIVYTFNTFLLIVPLLCLMGVAYYSMSWLAQTPLQQEIMEEIVQSLFPLVLTLRFLRLLFKGDKFLPPWISGDEKNRLSVYLWLRRLAYAFGLGNFIVDTLTLLGLPPSGCHFLLNMTFFLMTLMTATFVLQMRETVGLWLEHKFKTFFSKKHFFRYWHLPVLFLLAVGYMSWAIGGLNSLKTMLFPSLFTLAAVPLAETGTLFLRHGRLLILKRQRGLGIQTGLGALLENSRLYKRTVRFLSYIFVSILVLETWGVSLFDGFQSEGGQRLGAILFDIFIVVAVAHFIIWGGDRIFSYYLHRGHGRHSPSTIQQLARVKTIMTVARNALRVGVSVPAILLVISLFGYDITPILASVGVAGLGLSLGAQSFIKDFLSGFFILLENTIFVGDYVSIDGKTGTVEAITLRVLRLRADDGVLFTIPLGSISQVGNANRDFRYVNFELSVDRDQDPEAVFTAMKKAFLMLEETPLLSAKLLSSLEIKGVNEFKDQAMVIQARVKTLPEAQDAVKKGFYKLVRGVFQQDNISFPNTNFVLVAK